MRWRCLAMAEQYRACAPARLNPPAGHRPSHRVHSINSRISSLPEGVQRTRLERPLKARLIRELMKYQGTSRFQNRGPAGPSPTILIACTEFPTCVTPKPVSQRSYYQVVAQSSSLDSVHCSRFGLLSFRDAIFPRRWTAQTMRDFFR